MFKSLLGFITVSVFTSLTYGQGGGTITGTVSDSTGALIPAAQIVLTNPATQTRFETVTTGTGNYTLPGIAVGLYTMTVEHAGFSKYLETNIDVRLAVTTRVDVVLKLGATTDSVEVTAESTLLKTESGEQSATLSDKLIAELPINFQIGSGAIRNPLSFIQMTPGATFNGWNNITINGSSNNFKIMFEGQESDSAYQNQVSDELQPSVEAIEQFTLQTSNFAAEYGLIGNGGLYNFTSKSGTNQFHGSAYEYFDNTFLNAGTPWSPLPNTATANIAADRQRIVRHQDDFGFSVGGPVFIPKVYNGRNKTFFFFNLEKFRDRENTFINPTTVPNAEYRAGNLSNNLLVTTPANRVLGTDFAGRPIIQNAIYDPNSQTFNSAGQRILTMFPNNIIPTSRIDPTAAKIMGYIPAPNQGNDAYVNNYTRASDYFKLQYLPSIKIDRNIGNNIKIAGYFGLEDTDKSNAPDGFLAPITQIRDQYIRSKTVRLNYDQTISPTLLFHVGLGFERHTNPDTNIPGTANFDSQANLGIVGAPGSGFPRINGIGDSTLGGFPVSFGPNKRTLLIDQKPVATGALTWVHNNHTMKVGADWKLDTFSIRDLTSVSPSYTFSANETAQPLYGQVLPSGTGIGSAWASFLLGQYDSVQAGNGSDTGYSRTSWALFAQDTWKITRKLTLDYGLRWDLQQVLHEEHDRYQMFSTTLPNPNANGLPGAAIYAGTGTGRCNCSAAPNYPYAVAPRIGAAYQLNGKTVLRGGWGLSYGQLTSTGTYPGSANTGTGNSQTIVSPGNQVAAGILSQPLQFSPAILYNASYDPGYNVSAGNSVQGSPTLVDRNWGRPSRVSQWNVSIQREVVKDLVVEASYIGNKAVWLSSGGNLINYNAVSPAVLAAHGLSDLTSPAVTTLLNSSITSSLAASAGFTKPYANFPSTGTVLQSLRPFPQFSGINQLGAPLGDTWYDAAQLKVTKRFSHGLAATMSYSFSKTEDSTVNAGSIYNRGTFKGIAATDIPNIASLSIDYNIPVFGFIASHKRVNYVLSGWRLGNIDTWQSGNLLSAPGSSNSIGSYQSTGYTYQTRVPGQPLYLVDINCGCFDPTQTQVLNPAAWQNQTQGVAGSATRYYNDFRGERRPIISASLGKTFNIHERVQFNLRAEFFNPLNQNLSKGDPSTGSPQNPLTRSNGLITGGFGLMSYTNVQGAISTGYGPRNGQLVARFQF